MGYPRKLAALAAVLVLHAAALAWFAVTLDGEVAPAPPPVMEVVVVSASAVVQPPPAAAPPARKSAAPEPRPAQRQPAPTVPIDPVAPTAPTRAPERLSKPSPVSKEPEAPARVAAPEPPAVSAAPAGSPAPDTTPAPGREINPERGDNFTAGTASTAAPRALSTPSSVPVRTGVSIARYAHSNRKPVYPRLARNNGEQGTVVLRVLVKADGTAGTVEVATSSGYPLLDEAARSAVRQWRFHPATVDGQPVDEWYRVPIPFTLHEP